MVPYRRVGYPVSRYRMEVSLKEFRPLLCGPAANSSTMASSVTCDTVGTAGQGHRLRLARLLADAV